MELPFFFPLIYAVARSLCMFSALMDGFFLLPVLFWVLGNFGYREDESRKELEV